mmetsp:Transcript_114890/g.321069  ORF Transcript_114890/g.321069 Transcript_114890/m.321069 type:complete len:150 (-) Transcript_114890:162-611(-)
MALVVSSWRKVQDVDNYRDIAGEILFRKIFDIAPSAEGLFKFGEVTDDTYKQETFLTHARGVVSTVDIAVELLERNDTDTLITALRDLGAKHVTYDVKYEHFPIVGEALLHTLEQALGDEFTPEVREAWTAVYHFITKHMTDGMKDFLE